MAGSWERDQNSQRHTERAAFTDEKVHSEDHSGGAL